VDTSANVEEAIKILQQLGLKEYKARCFVGLTRLDSGTAKKLSDLTEVPRTRVYDAVRVLEEQGLVEIHHSSPQQFRVVSLEEAVETLRDQYENRVGRPHDALATVDVVGEEDESSVKKVWSITGQDAVENRTERLIETANDEIVFVIGDESLLTENLVETLDEVEDDIELLVGTLTSSLQEKVRAAVPGATTFVSGLEWLHGANATEDNTAIGRLLLVDRGSTLVSSIVPESKAEQGILGEGFENGLVVIARRLMTRGLVPSRDSVS
jgi:sugar-specific transcriptional regulator TrmB